MTALRSRRLEALFGVQLDDLTGENIRQLVTNGVTEEFDLDYKTATYGRSDSNKRDLCGDVAALANTAGGIIVLGIKEDKQARATETPGVELTDNEVGRMRQIIAHGVAPMPHIDILQVLDDPANPAHGYYVIAVPRSPAAPHAVLVDRGMRFPRRNGATTRYLSEPEVAGAYVGRTAGAARIGARIDEIESGATANIVRDDPWLMMSLVPDLPGDLLLSSQVAQAFQSEVVGRTVWFDNAGHRFMRSAVGRRQLLADGGTEQWQVKYCSLQLYTDGAGVFGVQLFDMRKGTPQQFGAPVASDNQVADESITGSVMSGLLWLARHASRRCAAGGNATARAWLMPDRSMQSLSVGQLRSRFYGMGQEPGPVPWVESDRAEVTVALDDVVDPSPGFAVAVASLANEIGQSLGVPELGQFTTDGQLDASKWAPQSQRPMTVWSETYGIGVVGAPQ